MDDRFSWTSFDVEPDLPATWQDQICVTARRCAARRLLLPRHSSSREGDPSLHIHVATVDGPLVRAELPWLFELYQGVFRDLAESFAGERVMTADDDRHAVTLNVQFGDQMRYEAHVDTNPVEGILFATSHEPAEGGELVFGRSEDANSIQEIDRSSVRIAARAGSLIFFDGRRNPHYVSALRSASALRVVAAMNFYTRASPETDRPPDLDRHLAGYQ